MTLPPDYHLLQYVRDLETKRMTNPYEHFNRSHEHLLNKHDDQITRLQLQVQQLAQRVADLEQILLEYISDDV